MSDREKAIIQAIKDFPNPQGSSAQDLIDWIESVCPFTEELISGKLYEIWAGVDSADLVEIKQFYSHAEASEYSFQLAKKMYDDSNYPALEDFLEEAVGDGVTAEELFNNSVYKHVVFSAKEVDYAIFIDNGTDLKKYKELAYADIGNEDPQ